MAKSRWSKLLWMAALPLFGTSVLPTQMRAFVCRFSGALMDEEACCPPKNDTKTAPVAQLLDQGCCIVRTIALPKLLSDHRGESRSDADSQPLLSALPSDLPPPADLGPAPRRVRPPPLGPPLRLLKHSFLL